MRLAGDGLQEGHDGEFTGLMACRRAVQSQTAVDECMGVSSAAEVGVVAHPARYFVVQSEAPLPATLCSRMAVSRAQPGFHSLAWAKQVAR